MNLGRNPKVADTFSACKRVKCVWPAAIFAMVRCLIELDGARTSVCVRATAVRKCIYDRIDELARKIDLKLGGMSITEKGAEIYHLR